MRGPKFTADTLLAHDPKLAEIVRRLVSAFHPVRIYLFGSAARGESHPNSDYDLLVLVRGPSEPLYRLSQRAYSLLWDLGVATDILIWPEDLFARRAHLKASLPGTVLREGRLLYEA